MKNSIRGATIALLFALTPSHGFSTGIVADFGSYAYYVEQIAVAKKNYDEVVKTFDELQQNTNEIVKVKNSLEAAYNTVTNLDGVMADMKNGALYDANGISESFSKDVNSFTKREKSTRAKAKDWQLVDGTINEAWGLNEDGGKAGKPEGTEQKKVRTRQLLLRDSLLGAATLLKGWGKRSDRITKLTGQLEKKKSIADQTAFSNRLLLELVYGQQDLIRLMALMAQAAAAQDYEGAATQKALNARIKLIKDTKNIRYSSKGLAAKLTKSKATPASLLSW